MAQKQTKKTTAAKGRKKASPKKAQQKPIRREVGAGVCLLLAVFTVLACFQIHAAFLDALATLCRGLIGAGFYILPFAFLMGFLILLLHDGRPVALRVTCTFLVAVLIGSLVQLVGGGGVEWSQNVLENLWDGGIAGTSGGVVAGGLALVLELVVSKVGAVILCIAGFLLALITSLNMTVKGIILAIKNRPKLEYEPPKREHADPAEKLVNHVAERHIEQVERRRAKASDFDLPIDEPPLPVAEPKKKGREIVRPDEFVEQDRKNARREKPVDLTDDLPGELTGHAKPAAPKPEPKQEPEPAAKKDYKAQFDALISEQKELPHQLPPLVLDAEPEKLPTLSEEPKQVQEAPAEEFQPLVVPSKPKEAPVEKPKAEPVEELPPLVQPEDDKIKREDVRQEAAQIAAEIQTAPAPPEYRYPPVDLLRRSTGAAADGTQEMRQNAERLADTLQSFNIEANIVNVTRGPSVTRYELELSRGTKLSKVTNLADDIALALGASGVRIAAIPDKISVVGIEVPNKLVTTVLARDVIDSDEFRKSKSKISFAVGKDIGGSRIIGDIAKLPHMLIAGTTGSGKSVCMNSLIISLLYKAKPDEVKLIMVDPKMVELGIYNGIPHLLIPVVSDPKKAAGALGWAVQEMTDRYKKFEAYSVRDLKGYNKAAVKKGEEPMPQIVVIIDELADLMMVAQNDVETKICRLTQLARAAGIHLVIATQRPSVDVITGLIKANVPSRIAFAVASQVDSRTILGIGGAEKLLGRGDMLFDPSGASKAIRVQGAFISDDEVTDLVSFVKDGGSAKYDEGVIEALERVDAAEKKQKDEDKPDEDSDPLLMDCIELAVDAGQISASMIQRKYRVGYARAGRILDQMEQRGCISGFEGSKPRQTLITREQFYEMAGGETDAPPIDEE